MKYYFATFVIGLAVGLAISFLYCTSLNNPPPSKPIAKVKTELRKEVAKSEVGYSKAVDSLKNNSVKLRSELADAKKHLARAKQKNSSLQLAIYDLIDRQAQSQENELAVDENKCDSIFTTVTALMQTSSDKDSLYEKVAINLEEQLKNRDSTIVLKDKQYSEIKSAFTKSIENSNELCKQNKLLTKQVKRQKFKSKLLTGALMILTGAAVNYFIHH